MLAMLLVPLFIAGAIIGSFLTVVFDRLPHGQSIAWPPSNCQSCGTHLRARDLAPVISYLGLRGKCRYCHAPIPRHVLYGESSGGLATAAAFFLFEEIGLGEEFFLITVSIATLLALSIAMSSRRHVPLWVMGGAFGIALAAAPFWTQAGALRPFPSVTAMAGSELDADAAAMIAIAAFLVYSVVFHSKRSLRLIALAGLAGLFAGLPGLALALPGALALRGGLWGTGRLRHATYGASFPALLAACAAIALLIEPWADSAIW